MDREEDGARLLEGDGAAFGEVGSDEEGGESGAVDDFDGEILSW